MSVIDFLSLLWTALWDYGVEIWVITIIVVLSVCVYLLIKEYGRAFIVHLLHRRNLLSLCGILVYFCAFIALFHTRLFFRFSVLLRALSLLLYVFYIVIVLRSVRTPTLFSGRYLKNYKRWLKRDQVLEHRELLEKMPWYFLDANEKIGYQILKGKYMFEQGDIRGAYAVMSSIDQKLLYPEEISSLTIDLVYILLQMGNLKKAETLADTIQAADLPAYGFLKSYLSEMQGDLQLAWRYAQEGENAVESRRKDAHILASLYTQLGRLSFFRNNITEVFRYYHLALEQAKKYGDIRLLHIAYQNLLNQMQIQRMYMEEQSQLLQEYISVTAGFSLNSLIEVENFRIGLTRQSGDRNAEYNEIITGYRRLHSMTVPPEQYMIEVSTLTMLNNGKYDASEVLEDIDKHFDSYFYLPLPARFIIIQGLTCPEFLTPEQCILYERWTSKLVEYAQNQAMADLKQYEQSLPTDCVNERCWVILQKTDFTRRSSEKYDGQQVLQWMLEVAQIYQDSGQTFKELETKVHIIKQYDELIELEQLATDTTTLGQISSILEDAYAKLMHLPAQTIGGLLIEFAFFSKKYGSEEQTTEVLNRFHSLKLSPNHFSRELQLKITKLVNSENTL